MQARPIPQEILPLARKLKAEQLRLDSHVGSGSPTAILIVRGLVHQLLAEIYVNSPRSPLGHQRLPKLRWQDMPIEILQSMNRGTWETLRPEDKYRKFLAVPKIKLYVDE